MTADTAAFIYARSDSRRLPGKIFLKLGGHRVIDIVHARAARLDVGQLVVLTTDRDVDDSIAAHCAGRGDPCFRGDATDLVRRTLQAIDAHGPERFLRINGDCPLFEPGLADVALRRMIAVGSPEMISNIITRSFPYGIAIECIQASAYIRLAGQADPSEREHVTQHLYRRSDELSLCGMRDTAGDNSDRRLTLDTPEDARTLSCLIKGNDVLTTPYWRMLGIPAPVPVIESLP
jgi:spore coat polysaccharide biosynthesis protein SpsF